MPLGALIGRGRTAEVYSWGEGRIVKLYLLDWPETTVRYEQEMARIVMEAGLAAPRFYGRVELDGRQGLVYERVDGPSMLRQVVSSPWRLGHTARQFAALHAALHARQRPELHSQREGLRRQIGRVLVLSEEQKARILAYLDTLPDGDVVCHGDFHPDNILMAGRGPVVIDWTNASRGNAMGDVARTWLLFSTACTPPSVSRLTRAVINRLRAAFLRVYLRAYWRLGGGSMALVEAWMLPVAAARLAEHVPGEEAQLLEMVEQRLAALP
jgi:uncharacterized protein (TIGR02172 family)